ncbi:MAG: TetR/AcrR family transcriptional regulator [Anaerobacillus sp.]|uniref:TetR/AcrR family transcriptional regulator n=1 Tax=Anaerobacillus sp. TaxID=1872506 RepID=UPI00391B583A
MKNIDIAGKDKIIEAAKIVVSKHGVNKATVREIAKEAELSTGAIYHYYKSKEEILYDLLDQSLRVTTTIAEKSQNENEDNKELIQDIYHATLERFYKKTESRLQFHLMNEIVTGNGELKEKFQEKYNEWITRIEEILKNVYGLNSHELSRPLATWIIASVDGVVLQSLLDNGEEDLNGMFKVLEILVHEGLPHFIGLINQHAKRA